MKPQKLSSDIISTLPPSIIETILCLVPIKEAARTSILSREWRYKWTKIPRLVFFEYMFMTSTEVFVSEDTMASDRKNMSERCKLFYAIYQVLLMRQGPIHEFTLFMEVDKTCAEIDHILGYLSRNNTINKLKLDLFDEQYEYYPLPLSIFSLHHLNDLHISQCDLKMQPTFSGFARLTKLYLKDVQISMKTLLHIVCSSPGLKHFTLIDIEFVDDGSVSVIRESYSDIWLEHLKELKIDRFGYLKSDLEFVKFMLVKSPKLEKLDIDAEYFYDEALSFIRESCSDIWLEHLSELKIDNLGNSKSECEFVKFFLAKSPKLKKLELYTVIDELLQTPPTSTVVVFSGNCLQNH